MSLLYCSIKLQWVPGHSFLPRNDAADELTRQEALSLPSGSPCSLSPLISRIHSSLFSDWRRTVSSKFFAHGFPRFRPRNLCSIVTRVVCSLVFAATAIAFCWALISIGLVESSIFPAAPADTRPRTPLISFCTVQLRTLCAARSLATLYLFTTSGPGPWELSSFWGYMIFHHAHTVERSRATTTITAKFKKVLKYCSAFIQRIEINAWGDLFFCAAETE